MVYLYILLGLIGLAALISAVLGAVIVNMVFHPRHFTWEQGKEHERNMGAWVEDEFEGLMAVGRVQRFNVGAYDGVQLNAAWVLPEEALEQPDKAVVIMHGFGDCAVNSYKYAKPFLERGWAALIYDNRNAGESGGRITTLGFREKRDLDLMVGIAREYTGPAGTVCTHGESLGGATVILQACTGGNPPDIVVSDCPFMDMKTEVADVLKSMHLPRFPLVCFASLICRISAGFFFYEVSPINDLEKAGGLGGIPMLFVHGTADTYIPPVSSERLYGKKAGVRRLWLCDGATHARSIVKDNERYRRELSEFLQSLGH